jgi:two-component sensor histidine kinase
MSQETLQSPPDPTELLSQKIKTILDKAAAEKEIAALRQLRNRILSLEAYYLMMLKTEGRRSVKTLSAQGALLGRVKAFAAHLERIGLDSTDYATTSAIIALFPNRT